MNIFDPYTHATLTQLSKAGVKYIVVGGMLSIIMVTGVLQAILTSGLRLKMERTRQDC